MNVIQTVPAGVGKPDIFAQSRGFGHESGISRNFTVSAQSRRPL